ncbi:uncharacterized protein LOC141606356 [Silene latifolia]|uniref:uncharacterized protein LOC141606356 n=1 Tax=Silene latifolia TaxID=37657 RepID=UPI003D77D6E3
MDNSPQPPSTTNFAWFMPSPPLAADHRSPEMTTKPPSLTFNSISALHRNLSTASSSTKVNHGESYCIAMDLSMWQHLIIWKRLDCLGNSPKGISYVFSGYAPLRILFYSASHQIRMA